MSLFCHVFLSNSCKYAIRSVLFLASHQEKNKRIGVKVIAEKIDVPQPFLSKILQELSRKRLIRSTKGVNGGFYLTDENLENPLLAIVEAIDGTNPFEICVIGLPNCDHVNPCPLHEQAIKSRIAFLDVFKNKSIREVAESIDAKKLRL
jgi:Rrf2 family protein